MVKKILIASLASIFGLILSFILAVVVFLNWPTLILNQKTLQAMADWAPKFGAELSFSSAQVGSKSHGFMNEEPSIHFTDLCVKYGEELQKLCFAQVDINFHYDIQGITPRIISLGPIKLDQGELDYTLQKNEARADENSEEKPLIASINLPSIQIPEMLKKTHFYPLEINLDQIHIVQDKTVYEGKLNLTGHVNDQHELESVSLNADAKELGNAGQYKVNASLESPSHFKQDDWIIKLKADLGMKQFEKLSVTADLAKKSDTSLKYSLTGQIQQKQMKAQAQINGSMSEQELVAVLDAKATHVHPEIDSIEMSKCRVHNKAVNIDNNDGKLSFDCPVSVDLKSYTLTVPGKIDYTSPAKVVLDFKGGAKTFYYPDLDKPVEGSLRISLRPYMSGLIVTRGGIDIQLSGIPSKFPQDFNMVSRLDVDLTIEKLARLIEVLDTSAFSVPAPFRVLDGPVKLSIDAEIPEWKGSRHFPVTFTSRLFSENQKMDIDVKGEAAVNFDAQKLKPSAKIEVNLSDIKLQLPTFTPPDIPQLLPDSRIKKQAKKSSNSGGFDYAIKIKTDKPVQIVSNLAKTPIPIALDIDLTPEGMGGTVEIGEFLANLFNKDAHVESLKLDLKDPMELSSIDGRIRFRSTDYVIYIYVQGSMAQPHIIFESDPPLAEEDIISAIFFGEPTEALETDEVDTVGQMGAALTDRALGLSSLYLLSSTPIERVNYNPFTRVFAVKFRLGKGTSLTLGRGEDNYNVGLRRKLGKGWIIKTTLESPTKDEDASSPARGGAFLEWHKRY